MVGKTSPVTHRQLSGTGTSYTQTSNAHGTEMVNMPPHHKPLLPGTAWRTYLDTRSDMSPSKNTPVMGGSPFVCSDSSRCTLWCPYEGIGHVPRIELVKYGDEPWPNDQTALRRGERVFDYRRVHFFPLPNIEFLPQKAWRD